MDEPLFMVFKEQNSNKDMYYIHFVNFIKRNGPGVENMTFYVLNTSNYILSDGENSFLIDNLIPFMKQRGIMYEIYNINPVNGELLPPAFYLETKFDQGGRRELLSVDECESISLLKINHGDYGEIFIFNPDFMYSGRRVRTSPVYIAIKNEEKNKLEKFLKDVFEFSIKKISNYKDYILENGLKYRKRPAITWDDIMLDDSLKNELKSNIEIFFSNKEFFHSNSLPYKRGFLFIGPPGNGKTMLCKIIAGVYRDIPFIYYIPVSEFHTVSELEECFSLACKLAPSVLCIEDIDAILKINISVVLNLIDGLSENEGVLLIATTNHPEKLDQNILNRPSRFDRIFKIDPPGKEMRFRMLEKYMGKFFDKQILLDFTNRTNGFSFAYLKEVYITAFINARNDGREKLEVDDVRNAIEILKRQFKNGMNNYEEVEKIGFLNDEFK